MLGFRGLGFIGLIGFIGVTWRPRAVVSKVIIRVTPFRALIALLITHLLRAIPMMIITGDSQGLCLRFRVQGLGFRILLLMI